MKTLVINGSPRKKGVIDTMMKQAAGLSPTGTEIIDLYSMEIKPCTACMACRKTGVCSLPEDDGQRIARKIRETDLLVIGSPTHWANMSAALKNMFDRMVPVFMGESKSGIPSARLRGKKAIVVVSCTTPYPFNVLFGQSRGAVRAIREILKTGGMSVKKIEIPGTKPMKSVSGRYKNKLARLIRKASSPF